MKTNMKLTDFEIFKFSENIYTKFKNNGKQYLLNKRLYLDIVLTDYCQANCDFCIADLIHNKLTGNLDIFKEKIKFAIEKMNVKDILLLGGEPTLSTNLIKIIKWLNAQNLDKIIMTTNGIRLGNDLKYRNEILSSGLTNINISFMHLDIDKQKHITNSKMPLTINNVRDIYKTAKQYGVNVRINNNIFYGNNDSLIDIIDFYNNVKTYSDSIKFSPLFSVDDFSVINIKTKWVKNNILPDKYVNNLFNEVENYFTTKYNVSLIENAELFGFVKNTMIPLKIPIIMNWNFGKHTGMMKKVKEENKINNLKLLPNNELSLSWNRESAEYFINTK